MCRLLAEEYRSQVLKMSRILMYFAVLLIMVDEGGCKISSFDDALGYLKNYGHLEDSVSNSNSIIRTGGSGKRLSNSYESNNSSSVKSAICRFQRFAGLRETGELDQDTMTKMSQKRCGVSDFPQRSNSRTRQKRYVIGSSRWPASNLLYFFRNYSRQMDKGLVRSVTAKALQMWSNVTIVTFAEATTSSQANIHFLYAVGNHGDGFPFADSVLAHTFYPNSGPIWSGDVHLNDNTQWTDGVAQGTNLLQVTTHELGHALGLGHSSDPNSVMQPFYSGYNPNFQLGQDDISGIQSLYGNPYPQSVEQTTDSTTTTAAIISTTDSKTENAASPLCNGNVSIDAITSVGQMTYIFFGEQYLLLDNQSRIVDGFPRPWNNDWPGLAPNGLIDAALYLNSTATKPGQLFLFSGTQYWRYSKLPSQTPDSGYPRSISEGFPGVPDNLDAAFVWGKNNYVYFVKGSFYYRYTISSGVDSQFPKPLSLWTGFATTQKISAAFRNSDGVTYFFSGPVFYVFNDVFFKVGNALSVGAYWFGCSN